jgi:hypothetical protein
MKSLWEGFLNSPPFQKEKLKAMKAEEMRKKEKWNRNGRKKKCE